MTDSDSVAVAPRKHRIEVYIRRPKEFEVLRILYGAVSGADRSRRMTAIQTEFGRASLNKKGYPRFYAAPYRKRYVHRVAFEQIAGRPVRAGFQIHHNPNPKGKLCWCPHNLIEIQDVLHVKPEPPRNPWNGKFIDKEELRRMTA